MDFKCLQPMCVCVCVCAFKILCMIFIRVEQLLVVLCGPRSTNAFHNKYIRSSWCVNELPVVAP